MQKNHSGRLDATTTTTTRRRFLRTSSVAAVAGTLGIARAAHAAGGDEIKVALIGCGGRGTGAAANALNADGGVRLVAVADAFQNRVDSCLNSIRNQPIANRVDVPAERQFVGFDSFQKVIDSGVDVVLLATPPGFRPEHLRAAVDAGRHVFCEKPMATDAPGVRSILESAAKAKEKNLALGSGFCWRYHHARRAFYKQIHQGIIGDIRAVYAT